MIIFKHDTTDYRLLWGKFQSNYKDYELKAVTFVCLFDLILYVPSTIFQLYRDGSSWVEPVLS